MTVNNYWWMDGNDSFVVQPPKPPGGGGGGGGNGGGKGRGGGWHGGGWGKGGKKGGGGNGYNPTFSNVEFLYAFDDDPPTGPTDDSNAWAVANVSLVTDTAPQLFGVNTARFNGISSYGEATGSQGFFTLATGDFVLETWVANPRAASTTIASVCGAPPAGDWRNWFFRIDDSVGTDTGTPYLPAFFIFTNAASWTSTKILGPSAVSLTADLMQHLVVQRIGDTHGVALDGVWGTQVDTTDRPSGETSATLRFGALIPSVGLAQDANIGDTRITLGQGFYPWDNFTPPTAAFPRS